MDINTKNLENENQTMHEEIAKRAQMIPDLDFSKMTRFDSSMTVDDMMKIMKIVKINEK